MKKIKNKLKPFMPYLLKAEEIWLVGGAIRDAILGLPLKDFDFAVPGSGINFARQFARQIKGTFVLLDDKNDEARVVYNIPKALPPLAEKKLTFDFNGIKTIKQDLSRRDFTINAIAALLPNLEPFDPHHGQKDIQKKLIKMISERALKEDPLRIIRGFRFEATLGFKITSPTLKAMKRHKNKIKKVAPERLKEELFSILSSPASYKTLKHLAQSRILGFVVPHTEPMRKVAQGKPGGNLLGHSINTVKEMEFILKRFSNQLGTYIKGKKGVLKLTALLHDIGKPYCYSKDKLGKVHFYKHESKGVELLKKIKERLKLSNKDFKIITQIIKLHMRPHLLASEIFPTDKAIWRLIRDSKEEAPGVLLLAYADVLSSGGESEKEILELIKRGIKIWKEFKHPQFKLLVTGNDLIKLGLKPGPIFKKILREIEEAQVTNKSYSQKQALNYIKKYYI